MEFFRKSLFQLLKETFEGPPAEGGSAYLDKGAGLFQTIESVDADLASRAHPSLAAHCEHLRYYVHVLHAYMVGEPPVVDWPGSWALQTVDAQQWEHLKSDLRAEYAMLMTALEAIEEWDDDSIGDSMAIMVHSAYHLGAIRQLSKT